MKLSEKQEDREPQTLFILLYLLIDPLLVDWSGGKSYGPLAISQVILLRQDIRCVPTAGMNMITTQLSLHPLLVLKRLVWIYTLHSARPARPFRGRVLCEQRKLTRQFPLLRFHHFQSWIEFMSAGCATNAIRFDRKFI